MPLYDARLSVPEAAVRRGPKHADMLAKRWKRVKRSWYDLVQLAAIDDRAFSTDPAERP